MLSTNAKRVFQTLNGVVCLYKPPDVSKTYLYETLCLRLCRDLNQLEVRPPSNYVSLDYNVESNETIITVKPSYADHVLVVGPRYQNDDIEITMSPIGRRTSGVCVVGINQGKKLANSLIKLNPVVALQVKGKLGEATQYLYKDEKIVGKATYKKLTRNTVDKVLASVQAAHQKKIFTQFGVHLQSQEAYDLAVQGMIRPQKSQIPTIYSLKCIEFDPPDFTLEIKCVNTNENYMLQLIHDLGLQLRTLAHCNGMRCIQYGPFTIKNTLLQKYWDIKHFLENMKESKSLIKALNLENYTSA